MANCDSIRAALDGLKRERDNPQQALNAITGGDPGSLQQKQILWKEIQNLGGLITATNAALAACLKAPPPPAFVKPHWNEEGPGPTVINDYGYSKAAGAIQALACDPIDADRVFVGTVGGGIWLSNDAAFSLSPSWVPQTDFQASLCMSAIAMSPLDPARNTLYAGFGISSHTNIPAGPVLGIGARGGSRVRFGTAPGTKQSHDLVAASLIKRLSNLGAMELLRWAGNGTLN